MTNRKILPSIGGAAFLVAAFLTLPARVAYEWFVPSVVQLGGISGSLWNGTAAEGVANGVYFTHLSWAFKPFSLLAGQLAFKTSIDTAAGHVNTSVGIGITGTLSLNDLEGHLSLDALHPAMHNNRIDGVLNIQMQSLVLKDGWPSEAIGSIRIGNLAAGALGPEPLGDFNSEFTTDSSGITGVVEDAGAIIDVTGTIQLGDNRSYSLIGFVTANQKTTVTINRNLRLLGSPDENGQRQFRFEGSL